MATIFMTLRLLKDAVKCEYDYIVVGAYMLFNRRSDCARVLLDVPAHSYPSRPQGPQVLSSLVRGYLSTGQSLGTNLNIGLSLCVLVSLTIPDTGSYVRVYWEELR